MNEGKLLFIAAIFLAAAAVSMARFGAQSGGRPWAGSWFALYGAGFFAMQAAKGVPLAMPASLALGVLFSALLFRGASIYCGRFLDHVDSLIAITVAFIALRITSHYVWGAAVGQAFGTIANFTAVGLSCWALLSPEGGRPGIWNRVLAAGFIIIAFIATGYSWARIVGESTLPWFAAWLVAGIVLSSLKVGAFIWAAEDHKLPLRDEASPNQLRARIDLQARVDEQESELETSRREVEKSRRLASLGTMASEIAHQISDPIESIRLATDVALSHPADAEDRLPMMEEALANCQTQADRCDQIVSSMLQFARNKPLEKVLVNLGTIVANACEQAAGRAASHDARIESNGFQQHLPILASPIELEQAILNILANACESRGSGAHVKVDLKREGRESVLTISDNGRGINANEVERVFEPFYTTRLHRGGAGLGLSVAHGIVKDHGGFLALASEAAVGTEVIVRLPLQLDRDDDPTASPI